MDTDFNYCQLQAEKHDRDRYILTLAAPASTRPALWTIVAFNHEVAKTREIVRDAHAGHLRLAWWREQLESFYAGAEMPAHEVARALGSVIRQYDLPKNDFENLLDARTFDLDGAAPASLDGLAAYAEATNAPLLNLFGKALGTEGDDDLATAWGLTGIIRALPFAASQNRCFLPLPMLHDVGLMPEQFHHLKPSPALSAQIKMIAERADHHLAKAQNDSLLFRRMVKMTGLYLRNIEKAGYNPFAIRPMPFLALRVLF